MCPDSIAIIPGDCNCNDYSKLSANTGINFLSIANSGMTGTGTGVEIILTANSNGTIIKSVTIKAFAPVTTGMVRLFISNNAITTISLYKEIPIPTSPVLAGTPTPTPVLQTFEVKLEGGLKLQPGYRLLASTQNADLFSVIAEGLDWTYASPLPPTCCNFRQETAVTEVGTVSTANPALDGTGTILTILFGASPNGSIIKNVTIKALQNTNEGMIRFFVGPLPAFYSLMKEIYVPDTTQSSFEPSFKQVVPLDFYLQDSFVFGVSTQLAQSFAITVETVSWTYPY